MDEYYLQTRVGIQHAAILQPAQCSRRGAKHSGKRTRGKRKSRYGQSGWLASTARWSVHLETRVLGRSERRNCSKLQLAPHVVLLHPFSPLLPLLLLTHPLQAGESPQECALQEAGRHLQRPEQNGWLVELATRMSFPSQATHNSMLSPFKRNSGAAHCCSANMRTQRSAVHAPGGSTMPSRMGQQLRGRPFLYRTPQALHSVRGPSGPHRHWGVWWQPQFRQVVRFPPRFIPAPARHTNTGTLEVGSTCSPVHRCRQTGQQCMQASVGVCEGCPVAM